METCIKDTPRMGNQRNSDMSNRSNGQSKISHPLAQGSTIYNRISVESTLARIQRLYGNSSQILYVDAAETGAIDIIFLDYKGTPREMWTDEARSAYYCEKCKMKEIH